MSTKLENGHCLNPNDHQSVKIPERELYYFALTLRQFTCHCSANLSPKLFSKNDTLTSKVVLV